MAAMFWVTFDCGSMLQVYSADAKSMKKADISAARKKAAAKAKAKLIRTMPSKAKAKVTDIRCVG